MLPLLTAELIARFHDSSRMSEIVRARTIQQIDGNPFGAEIRDFGDAVAIQFRSPVLRGKNRVLNFSESDSKRLEEILAFYRAAGLRCSFLIPTLGIGAEFARHLATNQVLVLSGAGTFYGASSPTLPSPLEGIAVREVDQDEFDVFLELFLAANEIPESARRETRLFESLENAQPDYHLFIAYVDGNAVAVGSLNIQTGIGRIVAGATLPEYRRRGCQTALLQRRLHEAYRAGCELVVGNAAWFSTSQHNLERVGLRPVQYGLHACDCQPLDRMRMLADEAMNDPDFVSDLRGTMDAFRYVDAEMVPSLEEEG